MPNYQGSDTEIPTGAGDPKPEFFSDGMRANCYADAINVVRSGQPSINPGDLGPKGTELAAFADSEITYQKACEADGLIYVGKDARTYLHQPGGYLVAFFKTILDMHWRRQDSQGTWSEKLPQGLVYRCEQQEDQTEGTRTCAFIAYYWVRPDVVKLQAKIKKSHGGCIIL